MVERQYHKTLEEVINKVQVLVYRREETPIRDRQEVSGELFRLVEAVTRASGNGRVNWRRKILELAAYAVFAATSDD
jgi:hypothetical protein